MDKQNIKIEQIVARLGEKIKAIRIEKGWSLKDLSHRSGISAAAIHKIESNGIIPTITTMMKISDALGKKISNFVEEDLEDKDVYLTKSDKREPIFTFKKGLDLQGISAKQYGEFLKNRKKRMIRKARSFRIDRSPFGPTCPCPRAERHKAPACDRSAYSRVPWQSFPAISRPVRSGTR